MATRTPPRARDDARASSAPDETSGAPAAAADDSTSIRAGAAPDDGAVAPAPAPGRADWCRFDYTDEFLAECRRRYEETTDSIAAIADDSGVSDKTVRRLADKHGWKKRRRGPIDVTADVKLRRRAERLAAEVAAAARGSPAASTVATTAAETQPPPIPDPSPPLASLVEGGETHGDGDTPALFVDTVDDLLRAVRVLLAEVGAQREAMQGRPQSYNESTAATRNLVNLAATVRMLEQIRHGRGAAALLTTGVDDDDMPRDIDEFRRALAERIEAFVRSRTEPDDAGGGGEDSASRVDEV